MERIGMTEFRTRFDWIVKRLAAGDSFIITRRGIPIARLLPAEKQARPEVPAEVGTLRDQTAPVSGKCRC